MNYFMVIGVLLICITSDCYGQQTETTNLRVCTSRSDCKSCITLGSHCAWCTHQNYTLIDRHKPRCNSLEKLLDAGCDIADIINPRNNITILMNDELKYADGSDVQIKPQKIHIKLRPNDIQTINVHFQLAAGYPVDLYYLMDLSKSMEDDKDNLAKLGYLLATHMTNISRNFRLGFGSFVDKVITPFVNTDPQKLSKPCEQFDGSDCVPPYGFHNHLPLDENITLFTTEVKKANVSGNLDNPEGGFDAIMQVIVCETELGWRNHSRKLLLFSSDAPFHYAGDGKLAGIVKPNDAKCHLNVDGFYTESITMDYPSVSQLTQMIKEKKINVIFAVTDDFIHLYEQLSHLIEGSYYAELAKDSSNIVELIVEHFEKITSVVEMKAFIPDNVKITFMSNCFGGPLKNTNICRGIKSDSAVTFSVSIMVQSCPENVTHQVIEIYPVGLQEKLIIDLELICGCACDELKNLELNSSFCSNQGNFGCGICKCYYGQSGEHCECDTKNVNREDYEMNCKLPDSETICSGRGNCECGICKCKSSDEEHVWGKLCECDNFSCLKSSGKICSGHGVCNCGECECDEGFKETDCSCTTSNETCIDSNGLECNGQGECVCGNCKCYEDDLKPRYSGPKCEYCMNCPDKCVDFKPCVQCKVFKTGPYADKECALCDLAVGEIKKLEDESGGHLCKFKDDDDCTVYFMYNISEPLHVYVQADKVCPKPVPLLIIIIGVIASIVAISFIVLLIWKLLTVIQDRAEFKRFEAERMNAKWDRAENPIYKQPLSTFKNPTYVNKLKDQ